MAGLSMQQHKLRPAFRFTYSISFAALLATIAAEVEYWNNSPGIKGTIIFLLVPLILVLINSLGIEVNLLTAD
jgi:amino acid transporter